MLLNVFDADVAIGLPEHEVAYSSQLANVPREPPLIVKSTFADAHQVILQIVSFDTFKDVGLLDDVAITMSIEIQLELLQESAFIKNVVVAKTGILVKLFVAVVATKVPPQVPVYNCHSEPPPNVPSSIVIVIFPGLQSVSELAVNEVHMTVPLVLDGTPKEVQSNQAVIDAYLGVPH